jgi:hypothetical protein
LLFYSASLTTGRVCIYCCCWSSPAQSHGTQDHTLSKFLRLSQPGGPGLRIYILQKQGNPDIPPGTGFSFRSLLRLAGLRWRYSIPSPHGKRSIQLVIGWTAKNRFLAERRDFYRPYCGLPSLLQIEYRSFQRVQSAHDVQPADCSPPSIALTKYLHILLFHGVVQIKQRFNFNLPFHQRYFPSNYVL